MTDTYNDTTGSRKKFLIPLVVLLLCAVSLTGAGYAYNASVTAPGEHPDSADLTIDLADGTAASIDVTGTNDCVVFTDNLVYTAFEPLTKTNKVDAYVTAGEITYALKITGEATSATLKVSSADIGTYLAKTVGSKAVSDLYGIKVNIADDVANAKPLTTNNTEVSFVVNKAADATVNVTVYVFIVPVSNSAINVYDGNYDAAKEAADFRDLLEGYTFEMKFTADSEPTVNVNCANGHMYSVAEYDWEDDGSSVEFTIVCANNNDHNHTITDATIQHYTKTAATCDSTGIEVYWISGDYDGFHYESIKEVVIPKLVA